MRGWKFHQGGHARIRHTGIYVDDQKVALRFMADGIPFTMFAVDDVQAEYERLRHLGVRFTQGPLDVPGATTAVLDDTCGNLIAIAQYG